MACFHPLKRFILGIDPQTGNTIGKITPYTVNHLDLEWINGERKFSYIMSDNISNGTYTIRHYTEFQVIPCQQCIGCRMDKSRTWANRMMLEAQDHEHNCFVTLTYDDDHLIQRCSSEYIDQVTGEICGSYSLRKKDLQDFMKRLRYYLPGVKVRYYACGEYGSKTQRPHFHLILFGVRFDDRKFFKCDAQGFPLYNSETLSKAWPFGFAVVSDISWQTCAYCARYVMKKRTGDQANFYEYFGLEPEFCVMSRNPGIAHAYYDEHKDQIYEEYLIRIPNGDEVIRAKPPKYFDNLYDLEEPAKLAVIKENQRKMAENALALELERTSLSYLEYLAVKEYNFTHKVKSLKRGGVE